MTINTLASYDETPYLAMPLPQTHPARLAGIAKMLGLSYTPPSKARVLEIGCASGVNLTGMAHYMPEAQFVGIDLSEVQIAEAKKKATTLNADNLTFHHMNLEDLGPDFGEFDYIIAHGVYSWIPPKVRQSLLRLCSERLSNEGIAYVSYNVLPGWRIKQATRDILMAIGTHEIQGKQRFEMGIDFLKGLVEQAESEKSALTTDMSLSRICLA
ncbi:MAG: class I SAM-dependent methyltransferase, partial [Holophagaceae bacterium]|nr:class I SAM-dependent methyltransferase [Holophagaceae bacterium]